MTTKKELERALELAVKVVVHYDDGSDCNGRCPLYLDCPVQTTGIYWKEPKRACKNKVKAHFLAAAKEQGKKEGKK